jgi:hypothetical protein
VIKRSALVCAACLLAACGTIGSPIPPEDVGLAPLIERQKKQDELDANKLETDESQTLMEPQGQDVDLPPLRPVGTR